MLVLFKSLLGLGCTLLMTLPALSFTIPYDLVANVTVILSGIIYFLPMNSLITIFKLKILVINCRLGVAVFKFVKSFIPGISGG